VATKLVTGDFSATRAGFAPASGGGTTNFLRADGTWAPASSGAPLTDGDKGDITVASSGAVWTIDNDAVTLAKLADIATARVIGRATSGTGDPEVLTGTQVTALLDAFTSVLKGLVPASGGGSTNFLRADGNWAVPSVPISTPFGGNIVSPADISATTDNWNAFGGDANATLVRAKTTGAAQDITGMTGGTAGRVCVVFNIGTSGNLTFKRVNAGSSAANQFGGPVGAGDISVPPGNSRFFWYDGTDAVWRPIT